VDCLVFYCRIVFDVVGLWSVIFALLCPWVAGYTTF